jgi:molybdate transport system substrate-binding protein
MAKPRTRIAASTDWPQGWSVGVQVSVQHNGRTVLAIPVVDLLAAVDRAGSISAAARSLKISYRHAWMMIHDAAEGAGRPLVETATGGKQGGGARLTEFGRAALAAFQHVELELGGAAAASHPLIPSRPAHGAAVLRLAAAISLQEVVTLVLQKYAAARPGVSVRTIFGASNELEDQIAGGSPTDVFMAASDDNVSRLAERGLIDRQSRSTLASNGLAVVGAAALRTTLRGPDDLRRGNKSIVVADPACPLGKCSAEFLERAHLLDDVRPRLQFVESSRAVVSLLRAGRSPLGIIFGSDLANAAGLRKLLAIPTSQATTIYQGVAVAKSTAKDEARLLLEYFASPRARATFRRCGFS